MFNVARVFESCPLPKGDKIAILTNAGGPGILATDCAEKCHLPIADLTEKTQEKLRAVLNKQASVRNPVDVIADATAEQYETAAEILLGAAEVEILFVIYLYISCKNDIAMSEYLAKLRKKYPNKPIVSVFMTTPNYDNEIHSVLPHYDIPTFR
jgi:acetyltransferase